MNEKRQRQGRKLRKTNKQSSLRFHLAFPSHVPLPSTLPLFPQHPPPLPLPPPPPLFPTPLRSPVDSHNTRRACSLLLSPGAREGWSTAQVMRALSSLRLTSRVSSLLTLYVGSSGTDSTTSGRPEVERDEKEGRGPSRGGRLHLNQGLEQH